MNRIILICLCFCLFFVSCSSNKTVGSGFIRSENDGFIRSEPEKKPDPTIDFAIQSAVEQVAEDLPNGSRIAIVEVTSQNRNVREYVIYEVEHLLREKRYIIVDRLQLDRARDELKLGISGEVDENTAVSIGKFTGANVVITGMVHGEGNLQRLRLRAIEVETGQVVGTASQEVVGYFPPTPVASIVPIDKKPYIQSSTPPSNQQQTPSTSQGTNRATPPPVSNPVTPPQQVRPQTITPSGKPVLGSSIQIYITNSGSRYHVSGCEHLSRSRISISLADATAESFEPCNVCVTPRYTVNTRSSSSPNVYRTRTGSAYHRRNCDNLSQSKIKITLSEAKSRKLSACNDCNPPR
jgi:hypothetical protein